MCLDSGLELEATWNGKWLHADVEFITFSNLSFLIPTPNASSALSLSYSMNKNHLNNPLNFSQPFDRAMPALTSSAIAEEE